MEQVLPCQPYILRSLTDADQTKITETGKNFFLKYLEAGLSMDEAYSFLLSLGQMGVIGTKRIDFFIKDEKPISIDVYQEKILSDNKIKRVPCETLYKRIDKSLSACLYCPVKCPFYEQQLALEKSVAAFVFASEDNFMLFSNALDKLKLTIGDCFFLHADISDSLYLSKPYAVPALKLLMETLYENEPAFFHGICAGEMESIRQEFFLKLEKEKRFPKELKEKKEARSILYARVISFLQSSPIQSEQMEETLLSMHQYRQKLEETKEDFHASVQTEKEKPKKPEGNEEVFRQFIKEEEKRSAAKKEETQKEKKYAEGKPEKKEPEKETETIPKKQVLKETASVSVSENPLSPVTPDTLSDEITLEELLDEKFDTLHADIIQTAETRQTQKVDEIKKEIKEEKAVLSVAENQKQTPDAQTDLSVPQRQSIPEQAKDFSKKQAQAKLPSGIKDDRQKAVQKKETDRPKAAPEKTIFHSFPTLFDFMEKEETKKKETSAKGGEKKDHGTLLADGLYLPTLTTRIMETYTKPMAKKDAYYLLNLSAEKKYLVLEVFFDPAHVPILVVYDASTETFFYVKNPLDYDGIILQLLSHKSIGKICVNPYTLYGYAYTFSHFAKNVFSIDRYGLLDMLLKKKRLNELPASLSLMTYYADAWNYFCKADRKQDAAFFTKQLLLDAAYGCSFMTQRFFKEQVFLFQKQTENQIQFHLPKKLSPTKSGVFLRYHLTHGSDLETGLLFDDLLTFISDSGRFKNIPFQIVYKDNLSLMFFVEEAFAKRFDAICSIQLTQLCETNCLSHALLQVDIKADYEEAIKPLSS